MRRPCASDQCRYYANVELKEAAKQESYVRRMVFAEDCENWRKEQMEDPCICLFLSKKEAGMGRPSWQEVATSDVSKMYWSYWNSLEVKDSVL